MEERSLVPSTFLEQCYGYKQGTYFTFLDCKKKRQMHVNNPLFVTDLVRATLRKDRSSTASATV